jgi:hypothetical protein
MKTFAYMIDPSHGWLRVPTVEFNKYPDIHSQVSDCSYQSDKHVFLEQDVDMHLFIAARTAAGIETKLAEYSNKSRQSKIRKYPAYLAGKWSSCSSASPITSTVMATLESNRKAVHILGEAA